jgi:primosomal protein N' (replication factor Y)
MSKLLGGTYSILCIDSDSKQKIADSYIEIENTDIILSTSLGSTLVHDAIGSVVFLSFEVNLSIPEYDMEEQLFDEILFYKKQKIPVYLQTYTPEHPLIREILTGNQKSFFDILQKERRDFEYPPFSQFVTIRVHHAYQKSVTTMMSHLVRKIESLK